MQSSPSNLIRCASSEWLNLLSHIQKHGDEYSPRGLETRELIGVSSRFQMDHCIVSCIQRKLSYRFMAAEALWILSGSDKLSDIEPYNKRMADYSDDGVHLSGAYGPRVMGQIMYVAAKLMQDPMTRQAVMSTWKRNPLPSKDIPCTLTTQFIIRNKKLHVIHNMRSSDIWLGYPYDIFNFSMVAAFICIWLREQGMKELELGFFMMEAGSQHLYERNAFNASKVLDRPETFEYAPLKVSEFTDTDSLLEHLDLMRKGAYDKAQHKFFTETEPYYAKHTSTTKGS